MEAQYWEGFKLFREVGHLAYVKAPGFLNGGSLKCGGPFALHFPDCLKVASNDSSAQ